MGVRSYESCGKVTQVTSDIWAGTERVITSIEREERGVIRGVRLQSDCSLSLFM